jgi:hypothetical protein
MVLAIVRPAVAAKLRDEDEEAYLWATASLGRVRARGRVRLERVLSRVVEDLAFGLGAWEARRARRASYARTPRGGGRPRTIGGGEEVS